MGKNWAITIGINGYRNLQRLNFAKQYAESMRDFFQQELNIPAILIMRRVLIQGSCFEQVNWLKPAFHRSTIQS